MIPDIAVRAADLLGAEWGKVWSVRSTYWSLAVALVTPIALSALLALAFAQNPGGQNAGPPPDPLSADVFSLEYAVIAVSALGVLAFSSEYGTGLILATFAAAPRRRAVLAAKGAVLGAVTLVAGEVVAFASFLLSQAILGHQGVSLSHPGVPGAVLAAGLLLATTVLLGLALGAIVRHTAGGIVATIAVIALPGLVAVAPAPWNTRIGRFALIEAARQVTVLHPATNLFSPGLSLLVLLAWPAVALTVAAVVITRRDV